MGIRKRQKKPSPDPLTKTEEEERSRLLLYHILSLQISLSACLGAWFARMNRSAIAATISVSDTWHQGGDGDEEVGGAGEAVSF